MNLDRGQPGDLERVADRPRVVGPRARIQQQPVRVVARLVELLDELALVVALEEPGLQLQLARELLDAELEPGQRHVPVVLGGPAAEHVEVHAMEDRDPVPHPVDNSSKAAASSSSATRQPVRSCPGSSTRTKPTRPPRRFLSRPTAALTAARSTAGSSAVGSP